MKKFIFLLFILISIVSPQSNFTDPIFDLQKIMNEPLDVKIIKSIKKENIVIQEIEFTSEFYQEKPIRIYGIIAFPEDAKNLPAIFWSMPGMAPAGIELCEVRPCIIRAESKGLKPLCSERDGGFQGKEL